jgi:type II secretory pathway pseudopilin PulG
MSASPATRDSGYSLVELVVSIGLALSALAIIAVLLSSLRSAILSAGERNDLHQRGRVVVEALTAAIERAGSGAEQGSVTGPLIRFLPPVLPRGPSGILTIASAAGIRPATLAVDLPAGDTTAVLDYAPGCPPPCGFSDGAVMLVFDGHGDFDLFTIADVTGAAVTLQRHAAGTGASYTRGSPVVVSIPQEYTLDAAALEVRGSDGFAPSFAVANGVVELSFEYAGDAAPPVQPPNAAGVANCLYDAAGTPLLHMPPLAAPVGTLAPLPPAMFSDGPWCGTGPNPFDADLLRIRSVAIAVRLQATNATLRGTDPRWFRVPGTGRDSSLLVRDLAVRAAVAPANLIRTAVR